MRMSRQLNHKCRMLRRDPGCSLGEGSGTFAGDPSLANLPGLIHDVGTAAAVVSGGAIPGGDEVRALPGVLRWGTEAIDRATIIFDTGTAIGETGNYLVNP